MRAPSIVHWHHAGCQRFRFASHKSARRGQLGLELKRESARLVVIAVETRDTLSTRDNSDAKWTRPNFREHRRSGAPPCVQPTEGLPDQVDLFLGSRSDLG